MIINRSKLLTVYAIVGALFSASYVALLPILDFVDRDNYINYIGNANALFQGRIDGSFLNFISNEPMWLLLNILIGYFFEPEAGLRVIIFSFSFIFFVLSFRMMLTSQRKQFVSFVFFIFLVASPQLLKNYILHLRQGVSISIFLILIFSRPTLTFSAFSALIAAQFHSSFYFITLILMVMWLIGLFRINRCNSMLLVCFLLLIIPQFITFIGRAVEARQLSEYELITAGSGVGFLFWALVLFIMLKSFLSGQLLRSDWISEFSFYSIFFYLALYFSSPYSARIFESCLPLVIISFFKLPGREAKILAIMFVALLLYQWSPLLMGDSVFRASL